MANVRTRQIRYEPKINVEGLWVEEKNEEKDRGGEEIVREEVRANRGDRFVGGG